MGLHRALPTGWSQVEPEQGKWDWKDLDAQLQFLNERGFVVGGLLNGGVKWNALDKPGALPVNNLPAWSNYVSAIVNHITAVVRRNEANDNAGFKLVYESTTGFKTAKGGWYTGPDNKQWHTVRWQIDDPQFVNYWGYSFALESDGSQYNRYYIQSVTVTKRDR